MHLKVKIALLLSLFGASVAVGIAVRNAVNNWSENRKARLEKPSFCREIAPIIFEHCAPCHRPGQSAPFSLLEYRQVRKRAQEILKVTLGGFMPPWLPEPGYARFANERRLSGEQLDLLTQWVKTGMEEGDPSHLPELPRWTEGWQLGEPDLILRMPEPYVLPASGKDVYRNFVIPAGLEDTRYVRAVEINPGSPQIVHHAVLQVDRTPTARELDARDPEPGYGGMAAGRAQLPDGHFVGWTPGKVPSQGTPEMAWRLDPGTDLVLQLHLRPSGKTEPIQASIGLYFAAKPPTLHPYALVLRSKSIDIPPNQGDYVVGKSFELPVDVDVLSVYPHAHYLGKEMQVKATLPDGSEKWLLLIMDWDFNWQDEYRLAFPIFLPKGSVLSMRYTYDNTADNPRNPHHPPRRVGYGQNSIDEMAEVMIRVLPSNPVDLETLRRHAAYFAIQDEVALDLAQLKANPSDAQLHSQIAGRYQHLNQMPEAIKHYRKAAELEPRSSLAHYRLADALAAAGDFDQALPHFQEADRLQPDQPDYLDALAQVLARHPNPDARDPQRAIRLAQQANALTGHRKAALLESLAIAHAAAGEFENSVAAAEKAIQVARQNEDHEQADGIQQRLQSYRSRFSTESGGGTPPKP